METRELMWLKMMEFHGIAEIPGPVDNPIIVDWFKEIGFPEIQDDETAWCSLVMNITAKRCGIERHKLLDARGWIKIGKQVIEPKIGHVVVFWRGMKTGWQGHVGLYAGYNKDKTSIFVLGGNQGNILCVRPYPVDSPQFGLLGFRELQKL